MISPSAWAKAPVDIVLVYSGRKNSFDTNYYMYFFVCRKFHTYIYIVTKFTLFCIKLNIKPLVKFSTVHLASLINRDLRPWWLTPIRPSGILSRTSQQVESSSHDAFAEFAMETAKPVDASVEILGAAAAS